jgi:transposase-like protein
MAKRRQFTREFKLQMLEQLKSKPLAELAKENNIHPAVFYNWKREFEANPAKAFAGHGKICKLESEVENYQRLVGKLYAQIEFLKKAAETLKAKLIEERIKRS